MANITKTVLHAVPTEWLGQDEDNSEVGIITYSGPRYMKTLWDPTRPGDCIFIGDPLTDNACQAPNPIGTVEITLDAEQYPLHALALWGGYEPAAHMEVVCGPSSDPNPTICDPYHFTEVFDLRSFYYDTSTEAWSTPQFSSDDPSEVTDNETVCFGWDWVRSTRNGLLMGSDSRVASADMPASVMQPWLDYRTKLRNLPTEWAGVGTATHLIVWPFDPDQIAEGKTIGDQAGE